MTDKSHKVFCIFVALGFKEFAPLWRKYYLYCV